MCGQVGVIFGQTNRSSNDLDQLRKIFVCMLVQSQVRGLHASGVAWLKTDGNFQIFKQPIRSEQLVSQNQFQTLIEKIDNQTTILMGHTRWKTRGHESNNNNNQPIKSGNIIGTHNGTILNADKLFFELALPRIAEVDSEFIFCLADSCIRNGLIDINYFNNTLRLCRGQISGVLVSRLDPKTIIILKGNRPLAFRIHALSQVVLYASEAKFIDMALDRKSGWLEMEVPPMTMLTIHRDKFKIDRRAFNFQAQENTNR